ncbi:MAG: zinc-binding dehydrogenase [Myxococcota bacterium]
MKQIWIPRYGGPEVLEVRTAPVPTPEAGEVRIRVEAAGVNFADLMARMGVYRDAPPPPMVVGYEVAGTIEAVGADVPADRVGQPVVALCQFGGYASHLVVGAHQAIARPADLDAVTAAAIPVTGLTAWMMVEEMARVRDGDRVLVHGAGGGVGLMCLDLIKRRRAFAAGTASTGKHSVLRDLGYDQLIDYRQHDYEAVLADAPGFDAIMDPVGGASWAKGLRLLRPGGRLICFGFSAGASGTRRSWLEYTKAVLGIPWFAMSPVQLIDANKGVMGVNMGRLWSETDRLSSWLEQLMRLWTQGILRPKVHATVPFSRASEAHRILHDRENLGKVVLTPD